MSSASRQARVANADSIRSRVEATLLTATTGQWKQRLDEAGVPCSPVLELHEALDQPQVRHRGLVVEMVDEPTGKPLRFFNTAFKYAHGTPGPAFAPPRLGENTESVLSALGCSETEIADLARRGIIGQPRSKDARRR